MFRLEPSDDQHALRGSREVKEEAGEVRTDNESRKMQCKGIELSSVRPQSEKDSVHKTIDSRPRQELDKRSSVRESGRSSAERYNRSFGARPKEINCSNRYGRKGSTRYEMPRLNNRSGERIRAHEETKRLKFDRTFKMKNCSRFRDDSKSIKSDSQPCRNGTQKPTPESIDLSEMSKGSKNIDYESEIDSDDQEMKNLKKVKEYSKGSKLKHRNKRCERNFIGKQPQAKPTFLYVVIGDNIYKTSNLKQFLLHRMGNPSALTLEVVNTSGAINDACNNNIITVKFESYRKASAARYLLHASNRNVSSKVRCFFSITEAQGEKVDNTREREAKLKKTCKEIDQLTEKAVSKHQAKINEVSKRLSTVKKELGKKRGVPLLTFDKLSSEKYAFKDKLQELEGQKKEFTKQVSCMKKELKKLLTYDKFDQKMKEVRKAFGVECRRLAAALPIYARRADILTTVRENQVCVILGETGSGKSTQIVQYLSQAGFADTGRIACTQPRKIAAVSLATHVASELASSVGQIIGYKVGMQTKMSAVTKVLFMTDHILLNECLQDRLLTKYFCILIDEAHERSIHTDLLLGMLKETLDKRPNLKVIVTSATIDPDVFIKYFGGRDQCPVLRVSGRTFPVDISWEQNDSFDNPFPEDYESKAIKKVIEIHQSTTIEEGDILIFVTSPAETERCVENLKKRLGEKDILCLQLHGKLRAEEQQLVFERTPVGKRKVVFATNSAETSITIQGIKFVVDTGVVKEMRFDPKKNMNSLDVIPVSQSSANQRSGRAGRTTSGICYRLYTEEDYKRMEKIASPEILRLQVSQAILKLMELDVDPMKFDYVQSPSNEAMQSAMMELKDIGAVEDSGLSNLGKWVAKLPIEPRLGFLIRKGIDMEIPTEAVVVASSCNQTGMFFRVGTQDEKKQSDKNKTKFCHENGDLLTMLTVYREWDKVHEKGKGKWCEQNCINGKVMKEVREIINEILSTLRKEVKVTIKYQFKSPDIADPLVQKLLFESMTSKLGYYLGHEQAGYVIINSLQRVQIHPSSAILSLGYYPTWIVFCKVLKTSADFITGITNVSEEVITEAVEQGKVSFDLKFLESQRITLVRHILVGKHIYWKFVGPMHRKRQELEEKISKTCADSLVIVETNRKHGKISLFCLPEYEDKAVNMLRSVLKILPQDLLFESEEISIGNENSGIRAVVRGGGTAVDVLMPHEYRSMNIWQKRDTIDYDISEESARKVFEFFGPVEQIKRPSRKKRGKELLWGKVTFTHQSHAFAAVHNINNDEDIEITAEPLTFNHGTIAAQQGFRMKITWCRRPSRGHCFVYVEQKEDVPLLLDASLEIDGKVLDVSRSKEQSDLHIIGLGPEITEYQVKEALSEVLGISLDNNRDRFKVIIPRLNATLAVNEWLRKQDELSRIISMYAKSDSFRVHVKQYKPKTVMCTAFVTFSDMQICYDTGNRLTENYHRIDRQPIHVSIECNSTIHVNNSLYQIVKEDIDQLINWYVERNSSTTLEVRTLKSGDVALDLKAENLQKLAKAKVRADRIIGGEEFNCENKDNLRVIFRKDGRQKVQEMEKTTNTVISLDERQMKIKVQGLAQNRIRAVEMIEDYISKHATSLEKDIRLKGEDNPPGLMKALLVKYGVSFENLKEETGVTGIYLEPRSHEITISGKEEAIIKTLEIIKRMRDEMKNQADVNTFQSELPDCPICLCPIEENEYYRLEYCGHAYCQVCIASQVQNAVSNRQLPVVCASENCNTPLVIRDIQFQIKIGNLKKKALTDAAVTCLVNKKSKRFHFCITPDCNIVYRSTSKGGLFVCPMCRARICTACHAPYHDGLTCFVYKRAGNDVDLVKKWLKKDPFNRKQCPKCDFGIEKKGGCDHMQCTICKAHICWKCLKYFSNGADCYGHLVQTHGLIV
ncbi:uncharacterized protein LOC123554059 [Mercenaria mercenaria]|uniref:uncharacterized protein LOC123554059 n=1 Tax=Mercenaria mercenaria TaxID=6596 RepID=UPI00234EA4A0|nr:uncharacterized protein LOC123554059 [Mercenaria mercenaria]